MKNSLIITLSFLAILVSLAAVYVTIEKANLATGSQNLANNTNTVQTLVYPLDLSFQQISKGDQSSQDSNISLIITNQSELNQLYESYLQYESLPVVDFTRYQLIAVFMGQKGSAGYSIQVTKVIEEQSVISVNVLQTSPASSCSTASVITNPYNIVMIPKSDKKVSFMVINQILTC